MLGKVGHLEGYYCPLFLLLEEEGREEEEGEGKECIGRWKVKEGRSD